MRDDYKYFVDRAPGDWDAQQLKRQASFLQSSYWADFQLNLGNRPHFLSDNGWSCLLLERRTPLGRYLFAPYGPTLDSKSDMAPALEKIKTYTQQQGFDWLIFEPMSEGGSYNLKEKLPALGARPSSHLREPDMTRVVDLQPGEDELLASISQSTRSYIRKNQREKILSFKSSSNPEDINLFIKMLAAVTTRKNVYFFPEEYFRTQAKLFMPAGIMRLVIALMDERPIACALFHDYGETSSYTFAASLPEARRVNASALLLWRGLLNAKARGMKRLDLFGIAPDDAAPNHPWYGFSSFKKKFGGEVVAYAGTWDIPLSSRYPIYRSAQRLRRLVR